MNGLITPVELREKLQSRNPPLLVDVRSYAAFAEGHIPGSLHIPSEELPNRLSELPRDRLIVTY